MALAVERSFGQRAVRATAISLVAALAVLEAFDELVTARRRAARELTSWWADVARRQRMELRRTEVAWLTGPASRGRITPAE